MRKVRWSEIWKKYKFVLLVVLVGVILMLLPTSKKEDSKADNSSQTQWETFNLEETRQQIEEILGKIDGVGKIRLMLTLRSGSRLTLAENVQTEKSGQDSRTQRETVTVNQGSSNQEVVITNRYYPVYQGAVVVCQGADNSAVQLAVTETVQALTGLGADRICVVKWTQ